MTPQKPPNHPAVPPPMIGVVLLNLGTPDGTDYWSMRRYLDEFLSDRRVIEVNPLFWQPLLKLVILSTRPTRSGKLYASIWNRERDESPLRTITRAQSEKLAARFAAEPGIVVDWAMRYGNPSTKEVLDRLEAQGCHRLVLMALYPQYAAPTTATAYDKAFDALKQMRWQPAVRTMPPYCDDPDYIRLLADSIRTHLDAAGFEPQQVLMSYHGMPLSYLQKGDPYHCMCQKTTRLVREALGWPQERIVTCFQSRFGRAEWLKPYLDQMLAELPRQGVKRIAVVSPAFASDCLETLEEIAVQGRESFLHHGGEQFTYVPALNESDGHIDLLEKLARNELKGWA